MNSDNGQPKMKRQFNTLDILAVAITAFNHNNHRVVRDAIKDEAGTEIVPNRQLVKEYTQGNKFQLDTGITADRDLADTIISYLQQTEVMQSLKGKPDAFLHQLNQLLLQPEVTEREFGLLVWAPSVYAGYQKKDAVREVSARFEYRSRYISKVGAKITTDFTLIESRYVKSMDCYAVYGHDPESNLIFYWAKDQKKIVQEGKLSGRVKLHAEDKYRGNAKVTTLNYVKAV